MGFIGIYPSAAAAATEADADNLFDGPVWTDSVRAAAEASRDRIGAGDQGCEWYERELIALLALQLRQKGTVRVLDVGGGTGGTFAHAVGALGPSASAGLRYDVVDTPQNCRIGGDVFAGDDSAGGGRIAFHPVDPAQGLAFDAPRPRYDLVLSSSTIQYARDWAGFLERCAALEPEHILFLRLLTGEMPTFTTLQTVVMSYGPHRDRKAGCIPCTFINRGMLRTVLARHGYDCLLDVFGSDYREPLAELPEPYCAGQLRTLLFGKAQVR